MQIKLILVCCFSLFWWRPTYAAAKKAERMLIMMYDQMRPDYIERYHLKNFKRLQNMGTNYSNMMVGHTASVTIVSHLVLPTGLMPKDLPWSDSFFWDRTGRVMGAPNEVYAPTNFNFEEMMKALSNTVPAEQWVSKRFKAKYGKNVYSIGEKTYSTMVMGGPGADSIIFMKNENGTCKPSGLNIPTFIATNNRYEVDCKNNYGTDKSFYPLDGNRYYPGTDKDHLGGDIWTADIALDIMKNDPNWGALFLTFGAIDKFGHMLGEPDYPIPLSFTPPATLKEIALIADAQLGRLLDQLEKDKLLDKTLIISSADHGAQTDTFYMGDGKGKPIGIDKSPQMKTADKKMVESIKDNDYAFWILRLYKAGKIKLSSQDTALRLWLEDTSEANKTPILNVLKEISKVTRIFELAKKENKYFYKEVFTNMSQEPKAFQAWARAHDEELLNASANDEAPYYVALLADNAGFGKLGDHGGNQEKVQRIPLIVAGPQIKKTVDKKWMRLRDVEKIITLQFDLPAAPKQSTTKF